MFLLSYIPILIVSVLALIKTNKENGFTGAYSGFMFSMIFYYIVIPFGLTYSKDSFYERDKYGFNDIVKFIFEKNPSDYIFAFFLTIVGLICFHLSYRYNMLHFVKNTYRTLRGTIIKRVTDTNLTSIIKVFASISFIVGISSLLVHTVLVGGLSNALSLAESTRGFDVSLGDFNYVASITKLSSRIITMSAILYLVLFFEEKSKKNIMMFGISLISSVYYYLLNAGRMPLLTFLVIFLYIFLNQFMNNIWPKIILLGFLSLPLIDMLSYVFIYFQTGELQVTSFDLANYLRQLSPAYNQLVNIRDITDLYGYQYFTSILTDVLDMLPKIGFEQTYEVTSEYFNGPNWKDIGGVPNDVISFGYMQFGIIGVGITLSVWGKIMYYIDKNLRKIQNKNAQKVLSVAVATQVFQIAHAADIAPILKSNLIFLLMICIFVFNEIYYYKEFNYISYLNQDDLS